MVLRLVQRIVSDIIYHNMQGASAPFFCLETDKVMCPCYNKYKRDSSREPVDRG